MSSKSVIVIGGGLAGLSSAVALAEAGFRVRLLEQRPFLGGRASSYALPGGEHVDNCQHVTLGCCTNLDDFYRRVGAAGKIAFYDRLVFVDRGRPPQHHGSFGAARRRCISRHPCCFILRSAGPNAAPSATPCWPSRGVAAATPAATRTAYSMLDWLRAARPDRCRHLRVFGASSWSARSTRSLTASMRVTAWTFSGRRFSPIARATARHSQRAAGRAYTKVAARPSNSAAGK